MPLKIGFESFHLLIFRDCENCDWSLRRRQIQKSHGDRGFLWITASARGPGQWLAEQRRQVPRSPVQPVSVRRRRTGSGVRAVRAQALAADPPAGGAGGIAADTFDAELEELAHWDIF